MGEIVFTLRQVTNLRALRLNLPRVLSEIAVNHFKDSFKKGGFTDKAFEAWEARKDERSRFNAAGEKIRFKTTEKESRAVLVKSGRLRRSVQPLRDKSQVGVFSDLPYSTVHNEGGHAGRGAGFEMKKRQFIGESETLMDDLERRILDDLDKAFTG